MSGTMQAQKASGGTKEHCAHTVARISAAYSFLASTSGAPAIHHGKKASEKMLSLLDKALVDRLPAKPNIRSPDEAHAILKHAPLKSVVGEHADVGDVPHLKSHRDKLRRAHNIATSALKAPELDEMRHLLNLELYALGMNDIQKMTPEKARKHIGNLLAQAEFQIAGLELQAAIDSTIAHAGPGQLAARL